MRKCYICGNDFKPKKNNAKYCSPGCRAIGTQENREKWEQETGFKEKQKLVKRERRKRMTVEQKELERQRRKEQYEISAKEKELIRICQNCSKKYKRSDDGGGYKYCSESCVKEVRRAENRERNRKANNLYEKYEEQRCCKHCGKDISDKSLGTGYCNDDCRQTYYDRLKGHVPMEEHLKSLAEQKRETQLLKNKERKAKMKTKQCAECGNEFETTNRLNLTCSSECSKRRRNRLAWQRKEKRLNANNVVDKDISLKVLYKRDKGTCYLCGKQCNPKDYDTTGGHFTSGPTYPSIDHLIPLARGGMHAWDNVRLAHHRCNSLKSDFIIDEVKKHMPDNAYVLSRKVLPNKKEVKQFSKNGKLIMVFESTSEASKQTGIKVKGIQKCARGECPSYKGYVWSYK